MTGWDVVASLVALAATALVIAVDRAVTWLTTRR